MARKIFVSYKHSDSDVQQLNRFNAATARDYVDHLERLFEGDHIYKGEREDIRPCGFPDYRFQRGRMLCLARGNSQTLAAGAGQNQGLYRNA